MSVASELRGGGIVWDPDTEVAMAIRTALLGVILAAHCVVVAGCASPGDTTRGRTQQVFLQTDPPGATCTVARDGAVLATVEATPGYAMVERRSEPIEVSCSRPGYLAHRESFASENAKYVEADEGVEREPTVGEAAARDVAVGATTSAVQFTAAASGAGLMGAAAVAAAAPVVLVGLVAAPAYGIYQYANNPPYAIRHTPVMLMTPASFESPAERDAFFAHRVAQLQAYAETELAQSKDRCGGGYCQYLFGKIEAAHKFRLHSLDADRSQSGIVAPKQRDSF